MQLPDVNVLVNAFRKDGSHHVVCRDWLRRSCEGADQFAISQLSLAAFIRVATNKRIYAMPSAVSDAVVFANNVLKVPHCVRLEPGPRHWLMFTNLLAETGISGPQTTDVWFAALAIEWSCEWVTLDRGFSRFKGLRCRAP